MSGLRTCPDCGHTGHIETMWPDCPNCELDAQEGFNHTIQEKQETMKTVCAEIVEIAREYERQYEKRGYVDSPGGLEHMGDVWTQIQVWAGMINPNYKSKGEA